MGSYSDNKIPTTALKIKEPKPQKTYIEIKRLEKFSYLRRMLELREEIHSATTVMRSLRDDPCCHPIIEDSVCRQLGVRRGSRIFSLLAEYKLYLQEQNKEMNKEFIKNIKEVI